MLWSENMENARTVDIHQLNAKQTYFVIRSIVNQIENEADFDTIIKEANAMSEKQRSKGNTYTGNIFNHGNMKNAIIGDNTTVMFTQTVGNINQFHTEAIEARKIIAESEEMEHVPKLLSSLSSLATIAKFFGFKP